jgi:hypothetical protein
LLPDVFLDVMIGRGRNVMRVEMRYAMPTAGAISKQLNAEARQGYIKLTVPGGWCEILNKG